MAEVERDYSKLSATEQSSRHPWWKFASNSMLQIVATLNGSVQGIYLVFFYVQILGLENRFVLLHDGEIGHSQYLSHTSVLFRQWVCIVEHHLSQ